MDVKLFLQGAEPVVEGEIRWTTERKGAPGKLEFTLVDDGRVAIQEGDPVRLTVDGKALFLGYVFRLSGSKDKRMKVLAYDQTRYLKNRDTYVFEEMTAAGVIRQIALDYGLRLGEIEETGHLIPSRVEENTTLLDMMQTALEITLTHTRRLYVLYDDAGKLTLRDASRMQAGVLIDEETAEDFEYASSIDEKTYNRVKLIYEDEKSGERQVFTAQDAANSAQWGTLQYFETIDDVNGAQNKANMLLSLYNAKTKTLRIRNALGHTAVRAGSIVLLRLKVGDITLNNNMIVEKCVHVFSNELHLMDLTLYASKGGL